MFIKTKIINENKINGVAKLTYAFFHFVICVSPGQTKLVYFTNVSQCALTTNSETDFSDPSLDAIYLSGLD